MTKKTTPEQDKILETLQGKGQTLQNARDLQESAMKEVHSWVRTGFKAGISGYKLAKSSGMSLPRIYQLRPDGEGESASETAQASTSD